MLGEDRHSRGVAANMRVLVLVASLALAAASVVKDDTTVVIGKDNMGESSILC